MKHYGQKYPTNTSFKRVNIPSDGVHVFIVTSNMDLQHRAGHLKVGGNLANAGTY